MQDERLRSTSQTSIDPRLRTLLLAVRAGLIAIVRAIEVYCEIKRPAEFS